MLSRVPRKTGKLHTGLAARRCEFAVLGFYGVELAVNLEHATKAFSMTKKRGVFISYRRSDTRELAALLSHQLERYFAKREVFRDLEDLKPGERFRDKIEDALSRSQYVLVLIGCKWAGAGDTSRLHEPGDYVRLEVATALSSGAVVVPVVAPGATMPLASELPDDLADLCTRNAHFITDKNDSFDIQRLILTLRPKRIVRNSVAALLASALLAGVVWSWTGAQMRAQPEVHPIAQHDAPPRDERCASLGQISARTGATLEVSERDTQPKQGSRSLANGESDWHPHYWKLQCPLGAMVSEVAGDVDGNVTRIDCVYAGGSAEACKLSKLPESLAAQPELATSCVYDYGVLRAVCPTDHVVVGVSVWGVDHTDGINLFDAQGKKGQPAGVLCCIR